MNRAPVIFRVDASPQNGWENLTRCSILANALQRRRRPAYFLSQLEPGFLGLQLKRSGNEWLDADSPIGTPEDLAELTQEIRRLQPAAVIVDSPNATEDYLQAIRNLGVLVVSFDSQAQIRFPSRLIINPLLGPTRDSYEFGPGTQVLLGVRYALIRPELRRIRAVRTKEPATPFRAMVWLGEDDPNNQSGELARSLLNMPKINKVDVVVRSHHPQLPELQALAETCPDRLSIVSEFSDVPLRISRCHFAVTGGNAVSLELACIGLPQLVIVQSEINWPTAQKLEEEGAASCLGWHENVSAGSFREAVSDLLIDPSERLTMNRCGRQFVDGRGPDRLVTALEVLLHPSREFQKMVASGAA